MAKKKPQRINKIFNAIETLEEEKNCIFNKNRTQKIELIEINKVKPLMLKNGSLMHNRITYTSSKIRELANNIQELSKENGGILKTGILNPIMVRDNNGIYEIIHGTNRLKALLLNKQQYAPIIILKDISDELARYMRSAENLNREDLNPYDETLSILEHIQLACNLETIKDVKSFLNKVKNYKAGKSTLTEDDKILYSQVSNVFKKVGRFDIISFVDRLSMLNMNKLLIDALIECYINYSQARIINSKLKNKEEKIIKILTILKNKTMTKKELTDFISAIVDNSQISVEEYKDLKDKAKKINNFLNSKKFKDMNKEKILIFRKALDTFNNQVSNFY